MARSHALGLPRLACAFMTVLLTFCLGRDPVGTEQGLWMLHLDSSEFKSWLYHFLLWELGEDT